LWIPDGACDFQHSTFNIASALRAALRAGYLSRNCGTIPAALRSVQHSTSNVQWHLTKYPSHRDVFANVATRRSAATIPPPRSYERSHGRHRDGLTSNVQLQGKICAVAPPPNRGQTPKSRGRKKFRLRLSVIRFDSASLRFQIGRALLGFAHPAGCTSCRLFACGHLRCAPIHFVRLSPLLVLFST
jgi:hypothetical protein